MKEQWRKKLQDKMADYQQPAPSCHGMSWSKSWQHSSAQPRKLYSTVNDG